MAPRKKTEKSRLGCSRCKQRRIKCDGLEPECNNCLRRGFQCSGQKPGLRWSTKHEISPPNRLDIPDQLCKPTASSSGSVASEQQPSDIAIPPNVLDVTSPQDLPGPNSGRAADFPHWDDLSWMDDLNDVLQLEEERSEPYESSCRDSSVTSANDEGGLGIVAKTAPIRYSSQANVHTPLSLPNTLVEYWFSHICPIWSAFDSHANYNRKIPLETWTSSEPVFYALQAMSAAILADSMPQMNSIVPSLITQATATIERRISTIRNAPEIPSVNITIDLLFAVFALGTSTHWADAPELGDKLLQDARDILGLWGPQLSSTDGMVHAYFQQALTWWEMMTTLADQESKHERLDRKRLLYQMRLCQAMSVEDSYSKPNPPPGSVSAVVSASRLHPWCGASSEVIDLFGQCVALCRSSRNRRRSRSKSTVQSASDTLCDIAVARDLQRELLQMDFDVMVAVDELRGISIHTGDDKTPISHLVLAAEAYRCASLMQLYLTFEDLEVEDLHPVSFTSSKNGNKQLSPILGSRNHQLLAMAWELVNILEQIPIDSGSRCIQPPLLILAAAGLRLDEHGPSNQPNEQEPDSTSRQSFSPDLQISSATLEVAKSRRFVKSRLLALQATLPPKPIQVALDLINAIWRDYDAVNLGYGESHWLDVMNDTGLKTIFG